MTPVVPNTLRQMNATLVLNIIREQGPLSRAQIAKISGLTKATVSEIINDLLLEKIIFEGGVSVSGLLYSFFIFHCMKTQIIQLKNIDATYKTNPIITP